MLQNWLVIYDIRSPGRLRRTAKLMERYGVRVQKSVFETICDSTDIEKMRNEAKNILEDVDSLIIINLCPKCWRTRRQIGITTEGPNDDKPYIIL